MLRFTPRYVVIPTNYYTTNHCNTNHLCKNNNYPSAVKVFLGFLSECKHVPQQPIPYLPRQCAKCGDSGHESTQIMCLLAPSDIHSELFGDLSEADKAGRSLLYSFSHWIKVHSCNSGGKIPIADYVIYSNIHPFLTIF